VARSYWLKMVGAARDPIADRWIEQSPELLRGVRAPYQPSGIRRDDYLVYYAAGEQKLFAIARATESGDSVSIEPAPGETDWPYLLRTQILLAIPQLALAPHWRVLDIPSASVQQKSYIQITADHYRLAHDAIVQRTRP
jgi:hypothetical protein